MTATGFDAGRTATGPARQGAAGVQRRRPAAEAGRHAPTAGPPAFALLFALSVLVTLIGTLTRNSGLRLAGVYGGVLFGVGAAPLALVGEIELWARLGLSALVGFTVLFGAGALMADVRPLWHPVAAAILFAGIAGGLHLIALRRRPPALARTLASLRTWLADLPGAVRQRSSVAPLLAAAGTALWLGTAIAAGHIDTGALGLLTRMSPLWYVGIALVLTSIAFGGRDERLLAFSVMSLALATTLTPALVYGGPRTQSAAKHIDLVNYILRTHHIVPSAGIYQAYSAFFSGNAWACRIAGVSGAFGLATYWPVLLAVVRVAELRFLAQRAVGSARSRWIAVTLAILVDCLGGDYFSPQALGFVMALGIFALVMKGITPRPLGRRGMVVLFILASITLGISHELSPFIAAGMLLVLAVFGQAPYWMAVVVALPAAEWASLQHKVLAGSLNFSHLFSPSNFAPPKTVAAPGLHRMAVVGVDSDALLMGVVLLILAAAVGVRRHHRSPWAWAYLLCPAVGLVFIAFNSYNNEGIFRAVLFGIPWLAMLAVRVTDGAHLGQITRTPARAGAGLLVAFLALMTTFMIGGYALDGSGVLRRTDMRAVQVFLHRAPQYSFMVPLGYGDDPAADPSFGVASTAAGRVELPLPWQIAAPRSLQGSRIPGPADLELFDVTYKRIATEYHAQRSSQLYVMWTKPLMLYSEEYGKQSGAQSRKWLALLRSSPQWQTVFHAGDTYLFRLRTTITPLRGIAPPIPPSVS